MGSYLNKLFSCGPTAHANDTGISYLGWDWVWQFVHETGPIEDSWTWFHAVLYVSPPHRVELQIGSIPKADTTRIPLSHPLAPLPTRNMIRRHFTHPWTSVACLLYPRSYIAPSSSHQFNIWENLKTQLLMLSCALSLRPNLKLLAVQSTWLWLTLNTFSSLVLIRPYTKRSRSHNYGVPLFRILAEFLNSLFSIWSPKGQIPRARIFDACS